MKRLMIHSPREQLCATIRAIGTYQVSTATTTSRDGEISKACDVSIPVGIASIVKSCLVKKACCVLSSEEKNCCH